MLQKELEKIGLSEKEAKVYLSMLEIGKSPVQDIAKKANVNRVTTYNIIDTLADKGLISSLTQGKKTYYTAESPDRLISLLELKEFELDEVEKHFSSLQPELNSIYLNTENKPKLKFYEGKEGLKMIQDELLKTKSKQIYSITNIDQLAKQNFDYITKHRPKRVKKKITINMIAVTEEGKNSYYTNSKSDLINCKNIRFEELKFDSDIKIFDNKIAMTSYRKNPIILIVENKDMASSMRAIFDFIWNKIKK